MVMTGVGLAVSVLLLTVWWKSKIPDVVVLLLVAYFVTVSAYVAVAVIRSARNSTGVTKHRMRAVALGILFLTLAILQDGASAFFSKCPPWGWQVLNACLSLACGIAFYVGLPLASGFVAPGRNRTYDASWDKRSRCLTFQTRSRC
jgi:hypothetical protein